MDASRSWKTTSLTPDSRFLRDLAERLRYATATGGVTPDDVESLLGFADRWGELYNLLEVAARARTSPNLHNPSTG